MSTGSFADADTKVITWSPATEAITLTGTNGLYSPVKELDNFITTNSDTAASVSSKSDTFLNCMMQKDEAVVQSVDAVTPLLIRVYNLKADSVQGLYLNIIIKVGSAPTVQQKRAAAAMSFYIATANGTGVATSNKDTTTENASNAYYTTGYRYADASSASKAYDVASGTWSKVATAGTYEANKYAVEKTPAIGTNGTIGKSQDVNYNTAGAAQFKKAGTGGWASILLEGENCLGYQLSLGNVKPGEGMNILLYSWMDGWTADTACLGASVDIVYAFTNSSTALPNA